ncbi:hypothetical protein IOT97_003599 [Escherichia coli]|nr:hypothetical protein [Escherichia coli]
MSLKRMVNLTTRCIFWSNGGSPSHTYRRAFRGLPQPEAHDRITFNDDLYRETNFAVRFRVMP